MAGAGADLALGAGLVMGGGSRSLAGAAGSCRHAVTAKVGCYLSCLLARVHHAQHQGGCCPPAAREEHQNEVPAAHRRRASFAVRIPKGGAPKILAVLASLLEAAGGAVAVDSRAFAVTAAMPAASLPEEDGLETKGSNASGPKPAFGQQVGASKAGADPLVRSEGESTGRPGKRKRVAHAGEDSSSSSASAGYELKMSLLQESKACCAVTATIASSVPDQAAARFTALCRQLEQDLAQILAGA